MALGHVGWMGRDIHWWLRNWKWLLLICSEFMSSNPHSPACLHRHTGFLSTPFRWQHCDRRPCDWQLYVTPQRSAAAEMRLWIPSVYSPSVKTSWSVSCPRYRHCYFRRHCWRIVFSLHSVTHHQALAMYVLVHSSFVQSSLFITRFKLQAGLD